MLYIKERQIFLQVVFIVVLKNGFTFFLTVLVANILFPLYGSPERQIKKKKALHFLNIFLTCVNTKKQVGKRKKKVLAGILT